MDGRHAAGGSPAPIGSPTLLPPAGTEVPAPAPAPGAPPGGRRPLVLALAAGIVAVVVGVGLVVLTGDGDEGVGDRVGTATGGASDATWIDDGRSNPFRLATDGDVVCASGSSEDLYCLDAATGDERFAADLATAPTSSPAFARNMVLIGDDGRGGNDGLHAYSLDGREVWSASVQVRAEELAPRHLPVVGDTVAVIDDGPPFGRLVGVDVATGEERWELFALPDDGEPQLSGFTDVLTDGERFYVTTETLPEPEPGGPAPAGPTMTVVAVDPATGGELWHWEIAPGETAFPVATEVVAIADGSAAAFVVQSGGSPGRVVVLDAADGALRWEAPLEAADSSIAHLDDVTVVADGTTMRTYGNDGRDLWSAPMPDELGVGLGGLVVRDGRLFTASYDVYEIDPADGASTLVRPGASASDVVVAGDQLVIAGISGLEAVPLGDRP